MGLSLCPQGLQAAGPKADALYLIQWSLHLSAGMAGGLRAVGPKADIALVASDEPCVAAGVFTLNVMCAAPVTYCKQVLAKGQPVKAVSREPQRPQKDEHKSLPIAGVRSFLDPKKSRQPALTLHGLSLWGCP